MPATSEPRTLEEMHARIREIRARQEAAASRHEEQKLRRILATEDEAAAAAERAAADALHMPGPVAAEQKAALDAQVYAVLDPAWLDRQPKRIIARIAAEHGITAADITGRSHRKEIVAARFAAIAAVYEEHPNLSLPQLGAIFGGRDHTTILHALRRVGARPTPLPPPSPWAAPGSPEAILQEVAQAHGLTVRHLRGRSRAPHTVAARRAAIVAIAEGHPDLSNVAIGKLVSRDHTVVLWVLRRARTAAVPAGVEHSGAAA